MTNSANTAMGVAQGTSASGDAVKAFRCAIKKCDKKLGKLPGNASKAKCKDLGREKHACVHDAIKNRTDCHSDVSFDMGKGPNDTPSMLMNSNETGPAKAGWSALAAMRRVLGGGKIPKGRMRRPDFVSGQPPNRLVLDAKFPCGKTEGTWGDGQQEAYERIAGEKGKVVAITPADVENDPC